MQRKERDPRAVIGTEIVIPSSANGSRNRVTESSAIARSEPSAVSRAGRQVVNHRHLDRVGIRKRSARTIVTQIVGGYLDHTRAESQVLHPLERGINVGNAAGKGHRLIVGTVSGRE